MLTYACQVCRKYQGNRNPFVDKPELAARVFGGGGGACVWDTGPLCAPAAVAEGDEALQDRATEETVEKKRQGGVGGVLAGLVVACVVCSVCCAAISALWFLRRKLQKERASSDHRRELEMLEMREYRGDSTEQPSV